MSRQPLPVNEANSAAVNVRMKRGERALVERAAKLAGQKLSEYARHALIDCAKATVDNHRKPKRTTKP